MQEFFDVKIDYSPIEDFEWDADKLVGGSTIIEPNEKRFFEKEKFTPEEGFIRELVQNTLDAKLPGKSNIAKLELKVLDFQQPIEKRIYKKFINGTIINWLIKSRNIKSDKDLTYKALLASDFNTTGLDGYVDDFESNWNKYIYRVGSLDPSKDNGDGNKNLGKIATWRCSKLWMVFVRSKVEIPFQELRFMGRCLRNGSVKVDHKKELRDAHEFFVKNKNRNNVVVNDNLNKFLNKFFKLPRDKKGTDLLFPEFSIFEIRDLIPYALKNWFTPIAEENLELTIDGVNINKSNYKDLTKTYFDQQIFEGLDEEMMDFVVNTRNLKNDVDIDLKLLDPNKEGRQSNYPEEFFDFKDLTLKEVTAKVNQGKHLILKVPVKLRPISGGTISDEFYIGLKMRSERKSLKSFALMMRKNQILWDENKRSSFDKEARFVRDLMLTVVSKNQEINKLLTFFEDASHLYFNSESFTGGDYYEIENAKYILYLFRNVSNKIVKLLFDNDDSVNKDLLSKFFSLSSFGKKKKKKKVIVDDYIEDTPSIIPEINLDLPPSKSHIYYQDQLGQKLIIESINNEQLCGKKLRIEFGIKKRGNTDAFKKIDEFDFNLKNQTEISYYTGCSVDFGSIEQTSVEIIVQEDSFRLELKGIKKSYSHKSRYTILN